MSETKNVRVVELFAGVGGFRVGLERRAPQTFRTVWADQWEPGQSRQWAYRCYAARFGPDHRCVNEDIASVLDQVPGHDLLVGGFPCQDYSVARTNAEGIVGKKGVLWWSIDAIIRRYRPQYVLLENVDRLLRSPAKQRGRDFGIILKCLDQAGYAVEWRVLNAADYGHVQRRRRTFLFACRDDAPFAHRLRDELPLCGASGWIHREGLFAGAFPVIDRSLRDTVWRQEDLSAYGDLVDMTARFRMDFRNGGLMTGGRVFTEELLPVPCAHPMVLGDVVEQDGVDERYYLREADLPKWTFLKGQKRLERRARSTGHAYVFSEGAIAFPDPLDRPARTMLTSEGTTNRSTHVIADPHTGRLRRLTPEECERINGFDPGWTDIGMPERQRYFLMGNALVVPLIEALAGRILEILGPGPGGTGKMRCIDTSCVI